MSKDNLRIVPVFLFLSQMVNMRMDNTYIMIKAERDNGTW